MALSLRFDLCHGHHLSPWEFDPEGPGRHGPRELYEERIHERPGTGEPVVGNGAAPRFNGNMPRGILWSGLATGRAMSRKRSTSP